MKTSSKTKKPLQSNYEKPELTTYGTLTELTQGQQQQKGGTKSDGGGQPKTRL